MPVPLDVRTRALLDGRNFPVLSTIRPDGSPQSSVVWARRDDDTLLFVTRSDQGKGLNVKHEPRISVSVFDVANPYLSAEIRGTAEITDLDPRPLLDELAASYTGGPPPPDDGHPRVVVRVTPDRVVVFPAQ